MELYEQNETCPRSHREIDALKIEWMSDPKAMRDREAELEVLAERLECPGNLRVAAMFDALINRVLYLEQRLWD